MLYWILCNMSSNHSARAKVVFECLYSPVVDGVVPLHLISYVLTSIWRTSTVEYARNSPAHSAVLTHLTLASVG